MYYCPKRTRNVIMARSTRCGWVAGFAALAGAISDWRWLQNGYLALQDVYLDQPYCVTWVSPTNASDARWVCTITRNNETEGHQGEHTEIMLSRDKGVTWETGIRLEPVGSFTNAYGACCRRGAPSPQRSFWVGNHPRGAHHAGTILSTSFGRIYVIYNMNVDGVHAFPNGTAFERDDELGFAVTRWSDDGESAWRRAAAAAAAAAQPQRACCCTRWFQFALGACGGFMLLLHPRACLFAAGGLSWSAERLELPMRTTAIDVNNTFEGTSKMFWSVDQVKIDSASGRTYHAFTKVGA